MTAIPPVPPFNPWTFREGTDVNADTDLVGFKVEAADGGIGTVDETSNDVSAGYLVVDTGPWIFGRKVLLPAGTVTRIDRDEQVVYVDRTKDQIKDSPEIDTDPTYRDKLADYYGGTYLYPPR